MLDVKCHGSGFTDLFLVPISLQWCSALEVGTIHGLGAQSNICDMLERLHAEEKCRAGCTDPSSQRVPTQYGSQLKYE